jgi:hypothetical protein
MALEKQKILRINCPGYGQQSYFSANCTPPLYEYSAILVNPISILHLFDKDPDLLRQIEEAQIDGASSFSAKSDKLIESLNSELDARMAEMVKFLEQGGLLVYFLCRPFSVQGPKVAMDNYSWLDVLAPDRQHEKNERHMASVSHGKNIELTAEGQASPFSRYIKQAGMEWTTLIRAENLTDGYTALATAGPNKCVSAYLNAGEQGGTVVFLPAPYSPQFDDTLVSCLELWESRRPAGSASSQPAQAANEAPKASTPISAAEPESAASAEPEWTPADVESPAATSSQAEPFSTAPAMEAEPQTYSQPDLDWSTPPEAESEPASPESSPAASTQEPPAAPEQHQERFEHKAAAAPEQLQTGAGEEIVPKAKDLIEKMEEISKSSVPDWCQKYSFADLERMRDELKDLNDAIRLTQEKIEKVEGRIRSMEGLKNSLLAADGDDLYSACSKVFEQLGWKVKAAPGAKDEFWLMEGDSTTSIVRIIRTPSRPKSADVAQLAESIISYWGEHEEEPKGVLLASTYANRPPIERTEEDYTDAIADFAKKKNLCLITSLQLLSIYRDLEGGSATPTDLREQILSTSGRLPGFSIEAKLAATAS